MELMIAVAIVTILTMIAFPSYQSYIKRAHRSAVQGLMLDLANREQHYLLDKRSFLGGGAAAVTTLYGPLPPEVSPNYDVVITAADGPPPTFTITATPKGVMAGEAPFTLDQAGTKLPDGKWQGR